MVVGCRGPAPPTVLPHSVRLAGLARVNDHESNEKNEEEPEQMDVEEPRLVVVVVQADESTVLYQNCDVWSEEILEINWL